MSKVRAHQGPRSTEEVTASCGRDSNLSASYRSQHRTTTAAPQISGAGGCGMRPSGPSGTHEPGEASPTSPGSHISGPGLEQQGPQTDPHAGSSAAWSRPGPEHPAHEGIVSAIRLALRVIGEHRRVEA